MPRQVCWCEGSGTNSWDSYSHRFSRFPAIVNGNLSIAMNTNVIKSSDSDSKVSMLYQDSDKDN